MQQQMPEYIFTRLGCGQVQLPKPHIPTRYAATQLLVIQREDGRVLVSNSSPETWNQWMLPFFSVTGDLSSFGDSVAQAVTWLDSVVASGTKFAEGIDSKLKELSLKLSTPPTELGCPQFSIKYSPRTEAWTLYRFEYHGITISADDLQPSDSFRAWLSESDLGSEEWMGRVSSNIAEAFRRLAIK